MCTCIHMQVCFTLVCTHVIIQLLLHKYVCMYVHANSYIARIQMQNTIALFP